MYTFFKGQSNSASSELSEPRICEDDSCTFPFGPACQECEFAVEVHHLRKEEWSSESEAHKSGGEKQIPPRSEVEEQDQHQEAEPELESEADEYGSNLSVLESDYPSTSTEDEVLRSATSGLLDEWLSEVFDQTLDAQIENKVFTGSADEEQIPDPCPLCYKPLGDLRDQHLLRCAYARDEAKALERMRSRESSRGRLQT